MSNMTQKELLEKWEPILNIEGAPPIRDRTRQLVTAQLLENTDAGYKNGTLTNPEPLFEAAAPTNVVAGMAGYDPILISMIRRSAPQLISYDVMGVQPMTGPTGQIFAIRSRYSNQTGAEAFYNEANTGFATIRGGNTQIVGDASLNVGTTPTGNAQTYNTAGAMTTAQAEKLGVSGNAAFAEMGFSIEKVIATAGSRALKAQYSTELAQDLKAIHGLDAEKELSSMLSTELVAEINRETVRSIYVTAVGGSQTGVTTAGIFDLDTDSNGRWMGEKFAGLHFQIEIEANAIAKATRRGKGNVLITSSNVASALVMAGVLKFNEAAASLSVDDTGVTFAGTIGNRIKVYIDPYATSDYCVLGYKGTSSWDAGLYYCPYTPLQMVRAVGEDTFSQAIGFKTRYALVANPFSRGATASDGSLVQNSNVYYRRTAISNIM